MQLNIIRHHWPGQSIHWIGATQVINRSHTHRSCRGRQEDSRQRGRTAMTTRLKRAIELTMKNKLKINDEKKIKKIKKIKK